MADASRENPGERAGLELSQLPVECLASVFSKLDTPKDIRNACLVCRQWRAQVPASVTRLSISYFRSLRPDTLIRVLASYPLLADLRLPHQFREEVYSVLLQGIARSCPRLTSLDASGFRLQHFTFSPAAITTLLEACPLLQRLKLGTLAATDMSPGPALFLANAPPHPQLRSLTLERCSLPPPQDIQLSQLANLHELTLRECSFPRRTVRTEAVGDITALFTVIGQVTSLRKLHLWLQDDFNAMLTEEEGDGERLWLRRLGHLSMLQSLTLCGIWSTRSLPVSWVRCFPALRSLRLLRLPQFRNLATVFALTGLTELAISHCQVESIPTQISQMPRLTALAFTHSHNLREFPAALSRLSGLSLLDLSGNTRLRALPATLVNLSALKTLCLSGCRVLRGLPPGMETLSHLKLLDTSNISYAFDTSFPSGLLHQVDRGLLKVLSQHDPPSAPSLWCPLDPSLQLHPSVRRAQGRSHAVIDEDAVLFGMVEHDEWDDEVDDGVGDFGFGDVIEHFEDDEVDPIDDLWEMGHVHYDDDFDFGQDDWDDGPVFQVPPPPFAGDVDEQEDLVGIENDDDFVGYPEAEEALRDALDAEGLEHFDLEAAEEAGFDDEDEFLGIEADVGEAGFELAQLAWEEAGEEVEDGDVDVDLLGPVEMLEWQEGDEEEDDGVEFEGDVLGVDAAEELAGFAEFHVADEFGDDYDGVEHYEDPGDDYHDHVDYSGGGGWADGF